MFHTSQTETDDYYDLDFMIRSYLKRDILTLHLELLIIIVTNFVKISVNSSCSVEACVISVSYSLLAEVDLA